MKRFSTASATAALPISETWRQSAIISPATVAVGASRRARTKNQSASTQRVAASAEGRRSANSSKPNASAEAACNQ